MKKIYYDKTFSAKSKIFTLSWLCTSGFFKKTNLTCKNGSGQALLSKCPGHLASYRPLPVPSSFCIIGDIDKNLPINCFDNGTGELQEWQRHMSLRDRKYFPSLKYINLKSCPILYSNCSLMAEIAMWEWNFSVF